jgi:HK97 family phage prohead protease
MGEPTDREKAALAPTRGLSTASRSYTVSDVELRADSPESTKLNFYGHASVTATGYDMFGGPGSQYGGWTEYVDRGAFKRTLKAKPDVAFLVNHEGLTLARTKAGSLQLAEDAVGLEVKAQLDTRVSLVNDIAVLMEGGELDEMSFAFRINQQKWLTEAGDEVAWWDMAGVERHITEVDIHKGDVSLVNYGANPHTDAALRGLAAVLDAVRAVDLTEDELREAIAYFESRLPKPERDTFAELSLHLELAARR